MTFACELCWNVRAWFDVAQFAGMQMVFELVVYVQAERGLSV